MFFARLLCVSVTCPLRNPGTTTADHPAPQRGSPPRGPPRPSLPFQDSLGPRPRPKWKASPRLIGAHCRGPQYRPGVRVVNIPYRGQRCPGTRDGPTNGLPVPTRQTPSTAPPQPRRSAAPSSRARDIRSPNFSLFGHRLAARPARTRLCRGPRDLFGDPGPPTPECPFLHATPWTKGWPGLSRR